MIDPAGRLHHAASIDRTISAGSRTLPSKSQAFSTELASHMATPERPHPGRPSLPPPLADGQKPVSWRQDPAAANGAAGPSGLQGLVIDFPSSATTATPTTSASTPKTPSFDDIYWANQPAAVQQLRNIQNPEQRLQMATQLAQQGYSIDVPIMAWGWDPQITTAARQALGYTWVPSALQNPVAVQPGISYNGASYDPSHPPAGSITV